MTDPSSAPPAGPAKVDPETLVLRGAPGRVVRFRKSAVIAIAALSTGAVVGLAWMALEPATLTGVAPGGDRQSARMPAPEVLAGAPKSYSDVPQLGPPLPGDLGRPILDHQRSLGEAPPAPGNDAADFAAQAREAGRQRRVAEQEAARTSGVMMQLGGGLVAAEDPRSELPALPVGDGPPPPVALGSDPNRQQRKLDFLERFDTGSDVNPNPLRPPASPYMLSAGSIIAASLITGLNSDLPGLVTAQVTENAYDSVTGQVLLIPQGSRLIGSYDSVIAFGQSRALVVWQRIIRPDGSSIRIDNVPATDAAGYAGLTDQVDRHTWQLLKGAALSTLLGVGSELSFVSDESDLVEAIRDSAQRSGARAGEQLVSRNLDVQPTIRVRPGWPLRVVVHKDIVLEPWRAG